MAECLKCGRDGAFAPANHCPSCWAMRQESTKRAKERILGAVKRAGGDVEAARRELGIEVIERTEDGFSMVIDR